VRGLARWVGVGTNVAATAARLLDVPVPDALWSELDASYATWSP
jgi:hypothetical protein